MAQARNEAWTDSMVLNADDLESQDFTRARKGHDRDGVDRFRAKPAEQVRGVEDRLAEAQAAAEDSWSRLTRDIGEILRLLGEQAQRAAEEAAAEATNIISAAHADAAAVTAQAEAARRTTQEATEALRQRVAENIGVELALHDELAEAAQAIEDDMSTDPGSQPSAEDPLAQAVRDAVDRASTSPR